MKTWRRGRKSTKTPQQKAEYQEWSKERTKIANLVARKSEIEKKCCICGNEGNILHNRSNPYFITFICNECKKIPENLQKAEESRFDIRTKFNKKGLNNRHFTDKMVVKYVVGYMNEILSMGDYCKKVKLSRYEFNLLIARYDEMFPRQNIHQLIKNRSKTIQKQKILKDKRDKALNS